MLCGRGGVAWALVYLPFAYYNVPLKNNLHINEVSVVRVHA